MKWKLAFVVLVCLVLCGGLTAQVLEAKPMPDLVVESVAMSPAAPLPGQEVTFSAVVTNVGGSKTARDSTIGVGYFIDGAYTTWGSVVRSLAPGVSVTVTTQGGRWTAVEGSYTLTALVDDVDRISESDESNNSLSVPFTVDASGLPDVVIGSITVSPSSPSPGQDVTFSSVVRNIGSGATPSGVQIGVAYFVDGNYTTWGTVMGPLAPGGSVTVVTTGGPWTAAEGNHTVTAVADDVNRFEESDESNNSGATSFTVAAAPPSTEGNVFGMNIDPANPAGNPSPQELKAIGVRWVRIEWKWYEGGYTFYDPIIAAYRAAGLRVMLIVDYTSLDGKPAYNADEAVWTSYIADFAQAAADIAMHYGDGVDAWQIWNEPDLVNWSTAYDPRVPAAYFGIMLREAVNAIRPHSSTPIITGGLVSGNANYLAIARDAAGGLTVDAIGVHPYEQRAPDRWPNRRWGVGDMSDFFNLYLSFGLPLWVSEIGVSDQTLQADYLENVYTLVQTQFAEDVPVVFWFCWSDGMVYPHGILRADGTPKESYWRYQDIAPSW